MVLGSTHVDKTKQHIPPAPMTTRALWTLHTYDSHLAFCEVPQAVADVGGAPETRQGAIASTQQVHTLLLPPEHVAVMSSAVASRAFPTTHWLLYNILSELRLDTRPPTNKFIRLGALWSRFPVVCHSTVTNFL